MLCANQKQQSSWWEWVKYKPYIFLAQKKGTSGTTVPRKKNNQNFNEEKAQKKLKKIKKRPEEH